jgi:hypothetical protein
MGSPAKLDEELLTCEQVQRWCRHGRLEELSLADLLAVERHCEQCVKCRRLAYGPERHRPVTSIPSPSPVPSPPRYLAAQIKSEAHQRLPAQQACVRKRLIGSPHFLAVCAVITAGIIATLAAVYYFNSSKPREDAWAPAFVVISGGGTIILADSEDPARTVSTEEMLERFSQRQATSGRQDTGSETREMLDLPKTPIPAVTTTPAVELSSPASSGRL